jgi:hypothetical protein
MINKKIQGETQKQEQEQEQYDYCNCHVYSDEKMPIYNKDGKIRYRDCLIFLARALPTNFPSYEFILNLASYSTTQGGLTDRQKYKADEIIDFFYRKGFFNCCKQITLRNGEVTEGKI